MAATPSRKRVRGIEEETLHQQQQAGTSPDAAREDASSSSSPAANTIRSGDASPTSKARRLEPSFAIRSDDELRTLVAGTHPLLKGRCASASVTDFSAIVVVHGGWDKKTVDIAAVVEGIHTEPNTRLSHTTPVFSVDLNVVDTDEASELLHLVTFPLPAMVVLHYDAVQKPAQKMAEKSLADAKECSESLKSILMSSAAVEPVHGRDHLQDKVRCHAEGTYTVVWYSASWCPPCMRVLSNLQSLIERFPATVVQMLKADKDFTQPMYDEFQVEKIPTFQIFKNGASHPLAPIDTLQNSQTPNILTFIEKHCAALQFGLNDDDDF